MTEDIFITGGTGMVGSEVLRALLFRTHSNVSLLLHTVGKTDSPENLLEHLQIPSRYASRLTLICGDITLPKLGLDDVEYRALSGRITAILHSAASTRFDLPLEEARYINVNGTENVAQLGMDAPLLQKFGFVSTVYVSGKRKGVILETELEHNSGSVNTYECSKYEAEKYLGTLARKLPISIYRLSTVVGDSKSGQVSHFTAPHQALRIMYLGLASMIPGTKEYIVDLISSNFAADAICALFIEHFTSDKTYHIVAGADFSYNLGQLIDASFAEFGNITPEWTVRDYQRPLIVEQETFDLFLESAEMVENPIIKGVLGAMKHFAHQLSYPKDFSNTEFKKTLPDMQQTLPHIREYYPKVVRYCLSTNWGKHATR